jgi:hypothetical protein
MTEAVCSIREHLLRRSCQQRHSVFNARAVCSIVNSDNSGFFPPEPSRLLGNEQQRQFAQGHVSHQSAVGSPFIVIKADLALGDAKQMLNGPAAKGHPQKLFQARFGWSIGDKVFDFSGGDIAGDDEPVGARGRPATVAGCVDRKLEPNLGGLHVPLLRLDGMAFESKPPPTLPHEGLAPDRGVVHTLGDKRGLGRAVLGQRWPATELRRNLADVDLSQGVEVVEELGLASVIFVEGHPIEAHAVGHGAFDLFDRDPPFGPVNHRVGNVGGLAARAVLVPGALGEVQVRIEQSTELVATGGQMDRDDAVVLLARRTAVLVLHAGGFVSLLGDAGFINDADDAQAVVGTAARGRQVLPDDAALNVVAHPVLVPCVMGQEFLQGADGRAASKGNGLDALSRQVRKQSPTIGHEVLKRGPCEETMEEGTQVVRKSWPKARNLFGSHQRPPCRMEVDTPAMPGR